ncbi:MAG: hypothetical protein ABJE95_29990 [Byssovorax sp.]
MKNKALLAAALSLTFAAVACSSSTTTTGTGSGGGATSSASGTGGGGGGPTEPATSCKHPGDKGNENGVGTFCTPGGGECASFPKAGLCLADVGQDQWWCSRIGCKTDMDCGSAAHCHVDPGGTGCVPDACEMVTTSTSTGSGTGTGTGTGSSASTGTGG